jgi:hypothetical protein
MIHIAFLLHIYQPACQSFDILKQINKESYIPLLKKIKDSENTRITLNINASLTELLNTYELPETIDLIRELSVLDKIRFTGSAMYHPILPLISRVEVERQIKLNENYNIKFFKRFSENKGFFPPEMCISLKTLDIIKENYKWVIADGIACPEDWPTDKYYTYNGLPIFFRDSILSNHIAFNQIKPENLLLKLKKLFAEDYYIIFALDGETFGHHIPLYETKFLEKLIKFINKDNGFQLIFIDDILNLYPEKEFIRPIESSWSTSREDLEKGIPYPLWANPTNELHIIQNRLQDLVYQLINLMEKEMAWIDSQEIKKIYLLARTDLDKGEQSCKLWWSCPEHFDHNLILSGNQFLIQAALNGYKAIIHSKFPINLKKRARRYYENIITEYQFLIREIGIHIEYKYRFGHF